MANRKLLLIILLGLLSTSGIARAAAPSIEPFKVLTHRQMMMLTKEGRAAYIRELRQFMIYEERNVPNSKFDGLAMLRQSPGLWDVLLPKAEADTKKKSISPRTDEACYFAGNLAFRSLDKLCNYNYLKLDDTSKKDQEFCAKTGRNITCNRALFGTNTDGSPFCVSAQNSEVARNATSNCDQKANNAGMTPETVAANFDKLKPADWDDFAKNLNDYCKSTTKQKAECGYLQARLDAITNRNKGPDLVSLCQTSTDKYQVFLVASTNKPGDTSNLSSPKFMKIGLDDPKLTGCPKTSQGNASLYDFNCVRGSLAETEDIKAIGPLNGGKIQTGAPATGKTKVVDYSSGVCNVGDDPAQKQSGPPCDTGTVECESSQPHPACTEQNQHNGYCFDVDGRGKDRYVPIPANSDTCLNPKDYKKQMDAQKKYNSRDQKTMDAKENGQEIANQDMLKWGEEASRKLPRSADRVPLQAAPVASSITGSTAMPFNEEIGKRYTELAQKYQCQGPPQWYQYKDEHPMIDGAKSSTTYICYRTSPKKKQNDKTPADKRIDKQLLADENDVDRVYIRVHKKPDGSMLYTEVGTLNNEGRPVTSDVFADNTINPTVHIERDDKHRGFWPFKANHKIYQVRLNHCPISSHFDGSPNMIKVMKSEDGKYTVCHAPNSYTQYAPFLTNPQSTNDGLKGSYGGPDFRGTYVVKADTSRAVQGGPAPCSVKRDGKPGEGLREIPYDPVAGAGSGTTSAPPGNGTGTK